MLKVQYSNGRVEDLPNEGVEDFARKLGESYNPKEGLILYLEDYIVSFNFNRVAAIDLPSAITGEADVKMSLIPSLIRMALDSECTWDVDNVGEVEDFFLDFRVRFIP